MKPPSSIAAQVVRDRAAAARPAPRLTGRFMHQRATVGFKPTPVQLAHDAMALRRARHAEGARVAAAALAKASRPDSRRTREKEALDKIAEEMRRAEGLDTPPARTDGGPPYKYRRLATPKPAPFLVQPIPAPRGVPPRERK